MDRKEKQEEERAIKKESDKGRNKRDIKNEVENDEEVTN